MFANFHEAFNKSVNEMEELDYLAQELNNNSNEGLPQQNHSNENNLENNNEFKYFSVQGNLTNDINRSDYYKYIKHKNYKNKKEEKKDEVTDYDNSYYDNKKKYNKEYKTLLKELIEKDLEVKHNKKKTIEYKEKIETLIDIIKDKQNNDINHDKHQEKQHIDILDEKFEHIKNCQMCRKNFMSTFNLTNSTHIYPINNHYVIKPELQPKLYESKEHPTNNLSINEVFTQIAKYISKNDIKNVILAVLIGIIIIIILDTFKKSKR